MHRPHTAISASKATGTKPFFMVPPAYPQRIPSPPFPDCPLKRTPLTGNCRNAFSYHPIGFYAKTLTLSTHHKAGMCFFSSCAHCNIGQDSIKHTYGHNAKNNAHIGNE
jgi:hypothetical protein